MKRVGRILIMSALMVLISCLICGCSENIKIVVPKNATELERYAADEFAKYAQQMTGVECEISDTVGKVKKDSKIVSIGATTILNEVTNKKN